MPTEGLLVVHMVTGVKIRSGVCYKRLLLAFLLLIVVLVSLCVYPLIMGVGNVSLEGAVHVGSEAELNSAVKAVRKGGSAVIALNNDITLTNSQLLISDKKDITLTSNRTDGAFFRLIGAVKDNHNKPTISVYGGGLVRLKGIIVTHEENISGSGVRISRDGMLIMYGGKISGNHVYDFVISGNNVGYGGGVRNEGGFFKMYGGEISGNSAGRDGGGVHNGVFSHGKFSMFGGKITNNTAGRDGGGVFNYGDGSFYQFGGWIFGNTAPNHNNICNKNYTMTLLYTIIFASIIIGSFGAVFLIQKRKSKENKKQ